MRTGGKVALGMFLLALLSGAGAFFGYRLGCDPVLHEAANHGDAMAWIRHEYHLSPTQFAAIEKLHAQFSEACEERCNKIRKAVRARDALAEQSSSESQALDRANAEIAQLSAQCETALREHLRQVAAQMSREDGACYLSTMTPLLKRFKHSGPPDLRLSAPTEPHKHEHGE